MFTPGAETSGLTCPDPCTGPRELKLAIAGVNIVALLMRICFAERPVGFEPMIDINNSPFAFEKPRAGMTVL